MPNYKSLNFTFGPFRKDIDPYAFLQELHSAKEKKQNVKKINLDVINKEFKEVLSSLNLTINHIESFYKPATAGFSMVHIDLLGGDISKINWIFGGKDSSMNWFESLPGKAVVQSTNSIGAKYLVANKEDIVLIDSCKLKSPSLVQVGILHNVTNLVEDRFCVSVCFVDNITNKRVTFETAATRLAPYID